MKNKVIKCKNFEISNNHKLSLIAGPCQLESEDHAFQIAGKLKEICNKVKVNLIYKTSFDKANRTSISGKRGIGLEKSLKVFENLRNKLDIPLLTDVHTSDQCEILADVVDIIQIPAFLCRQTDLLVSAAKTKKIINVKKGQFLASWDMSNVTEKGASFGYNTLVSDMRSLKIMAQDGYPVVFDATHSVQQPGGKGNKSGGQREFIECLSKAATAVGIAAIFIETHQDPDNAPSDGPNMLPLDKLENLLNKLIKIDNITKDNG